MDTPSTVTPLNLVNIAWTNHHTSGPTNDLSRTYLTWWHRIFWSLYCFKLSFSCFGMRPRNHLSSFEICQTFVDLQVSNLSTLLWSNRGSPDIALHNSVNDSTSPPYPSDLFNMSIGAWIAPAQSRLSVNIPAYDIVLIRSLASVSSYCIFPETNLVRAGFNPSVHSINPWYKWCKGSTLHQL